MRPSSPWAAAGDFVGLNDFGKIFDEGLTWQVFMPIVGKRKMR